MNPGTVIVSEAAVDSLFRPYFELVCTFSPCYLKQTNFRSQSVAVSRRLSTVNHFEWHLQLLLVRLHIV